MNSRKLHHLDHTIDNSTQIHLRLYQIHQNSEKNVQYNKSLLEAWRFTYIKCKAFVALCYTENEMSANDFLWYRCCSNVNVASCTMRSFLRNVVNFGILLHEELFITTWTFFFKLQLKSIVVFKVWSDHFQGWNLIAIIKKKKKFNYFRLDKTFKYEDIFTVIFFASFESMTWAWVHKICCLINFVTTNSI